MASSRHVKLSYEVVDKKLGIIIHNYSQSRGSDEAWTVVYNTTYLPGFAPQERKAYFPTKGKALEFVRDLKRSRSRFGNAEALSDEASIAYTATLAKLLQRLKKDAGALMVSQNYRGTGSKAYRRQLWVRFASGAVVDLWLERTGVRLGGVVLRSGLTKLPGVIPYDGRSPEEVYAQLAPLLRDWANPASASYRRRGSTR